MTNSQQLMLLKMEHAQKLILFLETKDPKIRERIFEIENELGMTSEDIVMDVVRHYEDQY